MTVKTILNLPIATSVNTSDIILVSQGGVTKQATVALVPGTTGSVSSVGGTAPISSTGGANPTISITAATTSVAGSMSAADKTKLDGVAPGATANAGTVTSVAMTVPAALTVSGSPVTSSGTFAITMTAGYTIPATASQTNWDTAYTDRNKWDGGATGLTAATGRTSLGATTVGGNLFTLTNPTAVTFPRFNADNTVSTLDAATFRAAIGAGTSSATGTVTSASVVSANGFAGTVATASTTPAITISTSITGLLKGNGTAMSAATVRTDYAEPTTALATGLLKNTTTTGAHTIAVQADVTALLGTGSITNTMLANGAVANLSGTNSGDNAANTTYASDYRAANFVAGTNYQAPIGTISGIAKGNGANALTAATAADITGQLLTGYVSGSGTVAATDTILQAINKLNGNDGLKANLASPTLTGQVSIVGTGALLPASTTMAAATGNTAALMVQSQGTGGTAGAAFMSFHRPSSYAAHIGIDTDNFWKVGGWSAGGVSYKIWHEGVDGAGSGMDSDLLDGQHGSYYAPIASPTFTGTVTATAFAGSGASLTGLTSGQITTALGYTPGNPGGVAVSVISTNTTAVSGTSYVLTANLDLTLPTSPSAGAQVKLSNRSGVITCRVLRNGQNIMNLAEDMTIDDLTASVSLVFADATRGWVLL